MKRRHPSPIQALLFAGITGWLLAVHRLPAERTVSADPVELGTIQWHRSLDEGIRIADASGRPVLILFQEVPGCRTCQNYGGGPLSHPIIVEAIEDLFVPVAIFNNRGGSDRTTLEAFGETPWNNPVVRIINANRKELVVRLNGDYTERGLVSAMRNALQKTGSEIPVYLDLLAEELNAAARGTETGIFAMPCFWSGECKLGALTGVVATTPGFLKGEEVVEVVFDPSVLSYHELVTEASRRRCAKKVFTRNAEQQKTASGIIGRDAVHANRPVRPDRTPKYHLSNTPYRYIPMTSLQASRVNAAIGRRDDPVGFLSPRQIDLLKTIRRHPRASWKVAMGAPNLSFAWQQALTIAATVEDEPVVVLEIRPTSSLPNK